MTDKIYMIELCSELQKDIIAVLNLAQSGKIPLWVKLDDVEVYAKQDELMLVDEAINPIIVMPSQEVITALIELEKINPLEAIHLPEKVMGLSMAETQVRGRLPKKDYIKGQQWLETDYSISYYIMPDRVLHYNALPAITEEGELRVIKQVAQMITEDNSEGVSVHTALRLKSADLFAYEEDVKEYMRPLEEVYIIGRESLCQAFGYKSFNSVVTRVKDAGMEFDRTDDRKLRPMLKKIDVINLRSLKGKKLQKNKKNI